MDYERNTNRAKLAPGAAAMTEIVAPFQQFFDTSGVPLANGMIFIGTANFDAETNPIAVYWDEALTIPAAQPIRTLNGYPASNGAPSKLYVNADDYSITVRNAQGRLMYSVAEVTAATGVDAELDAYKAAISASSGSSLVGFLQHGASAVARTAENKMRDSISVKDFGGVGDGSTNDLNAINLAGPYALLPAGNFVADPSQITDDRGLCGPGEILHLATWRTIGQRAMQASYGDPIQDRIRQLYHQAEAINNRPALFAQLAGAPVSVQNIIYTNVPLSVVFDGIGAVRPSVGNTRMYAPPGARLVRFSGSLRFASNATGIRSVALYKNDGFLTDHTINALSGFVTSLDFNFTVSCADGDFFELRAYQTSGGSLNLNAGTFTMEILYRHPKITGGKRLLIYQGAWETQETAYGSYKALLNAVAQYDVLALSHVEAFGASPYPLLPNPNGILDGGYQKLKRLIHDYKDRNPKGIVFGYVSAAIDAPSWDGGGNPTTNTWTSATYPNLNFWMDLWTQDRHLPIDGFFFDHYAATFMSAVARDAVTAIAKQRGKKLMVNITSPSAANVQWAAECADLAWGDHLCLEGFFRDNGVDVLAATNATLSEMTKHETRGLLLAAVNEEAASTTISNTSINNINGVSLFNSFYQPGWCYQYGRITYDTIGAPGI